MKHNKALAAAVAATLGAAGGTANAAPFVLNLDGITTYSSSTPAAAAILATPTWTYDDATNLLTQGGSSLNTRFDIAPGSTAFTHTVTGLTIGNGGAATASTYTCIEGTFGSSVGASLCGNYNFGKNKINESTTSWGPGSTAATRTLAGDDMSLGPQQTAFTTYGYFTTVSWTGTQLVLSNASCNPFAPGNANGCATTGGFNTGQEWTLSAPAAVPVPAAAWLFGSALGLLGYARRKGKA